MRNDFVTTTRALQSRPSCSAARTATSTPVLRRLARSGAAVLLLAAALAAGGCASAPAAGADTGQPRSGCQVDLLVQFSPSVARPGSTAFLQGLVQGSGYDLRFVRTLGTTLLLRLSGPDTTCDEGIALLRRSSGVRSVEIDERQFRHQIRKPEA
jgi:hypothetical protein